MHKLKISVFGIGFVGLTTALAFAEKGHIVKVFDIDKNRCAMILRGEIPFFEPKLAEVLEQHLNSNLFVCHNAEECALGSDAVFICVGTPSLPDGSAKLTHVFSTIDSMQSVIDNHCVIVIKSTIPPGTLKSRIKTYVRNAGLTNSVCINPEFLREGHSWDDFVNADRIVCGVSDEHAKNVLTDVYSPFHLPIHFVSSNTAEFIKYLSNTLLATLISFSNDVTLAGEAIGEIDIGKAFKILNEDKRLSGAGICAYIYPGCGYGGYCLPKDIAAFIYTAQSSGYTPQVLKSVMSVNRQMPEFAAKKIIDATEVKSDAVGILGLSFKPNSDDVRDSPAAKIIAKLLEQGYSNIYAYDPLANNGFHKSYGYELHYCRSTQEVCGYCNTVALVTTWDEFHGIDKQYPHVQFIDCRYYL